MSEIMKTMKKQKKRKYVRGVRFIYSLLTLQDAYEVISMEAFDGQDAYVRHVSSALEDGEESIRALGVVGCFARRISKAANGRQMNRKPDKHGVTYGRVYFVRVIDRPADATKRNRLAVLNRLAEVRTRRSVSAFVLMKLFLTEKGQICNRKEADNREQGIREGKLHADIPAMRFMVDEATFDDTPALKLSLDHYLLDEDVMGLIKTLYSYEKEWVFWAEDNPEEGAMHFDPPYSYIAGRELGFRSNAAAAAETEEAANKTILRK